MRAVTEQVILVTGATDGLGRAVAAELAERGATLLLHGRDETRLAGTFERIRAETQNEKLRTYRADFSSLDEVGGMAERIVGDQDRIDVLVNNAGIGTALPGDGERMESRDGHELRFAVNYLAHFLLTRRLVPLIISSTPARIVNVSSAGQAPIDFDDVMLEHAYDGVQAYCQSKLAQVMLTFDLAEELRDESVTVNCLHPATYMPTKIVLHARGSAISTLEQGGEATLRLAADAELDGVTGRYFNGQNEARAHPQAYDPDARRRLRELSERLAGATGR
jgi:NAD(P)-dependent dehydrogenase (short-subunit alcohol dehydrogenase family)